MKWTLTHDGDRRIKKKFALFPTKCAYDGVRIWLESYYTCQVYVQDIFEPYGYWRTCIRTQDINVAIAFEKKQECYKIL